MAYKAWITAWVLVLLSGMVCPAIASGPELREIRFEKGTDGEERVLFVLNGDHPPKTFAIEGKKPRLICDFPGVRIDGKVKHLIEVHGGLIKTIRVGIHLSPVPKTRVVLDLQPDQDYEIRQAFFVDRNIYALVLLLKSEVGGRRSVVKGRRSGVGGRTSDIGRQTSSTDIGQREYHGKHSDCR